MSVIADDDIIDQTDYDEFTGVANREIFEEEEVEETVVIMDHPEISPHWQVSSEHTFTKEHFCKVTSCEYCGKIIASLHWHQGLRCTECSFDCHFDCAPLVPKNCLTLHDQAPLRPDLLQPHTFYEKHFSSITFCNVCRKMMTGLGKQGFACATCQFVAHESCLPKAPINCPPQKLEAALSEPLRHYWVEGNLSGNCAMCRQSLSKLTILFGFRCSYCTLKVCPACYSQFQNDPCDEGPLASLKLGPGNFITHATDNLQNWTITVPEDRRPLLVFINKKSGGQVGKIIAQRLSRVVNPNQIVDLSQGGPMPMLKMMQRTKAPYRILACGGDGTAAWLLSALDKMIEEGATYVPPVAVLPLGTGNDLARVLGWGGGYDNEGLAPICAKIMNGHEVHLDRWQLDVDHIGDDGDGPQHPKIMNNYFSIGIDAKIALDFHRKREANPSQFKSRGINKVIYAGLGATAMFESLPNLSEELRIELDGQVLNLPKSLVGVMAINLASYAGGKNIWGNPGKSEGRAPQSPCDGLFELIGINTTFHLGTMQTHLVDGERLGQGRDVVFTWLKDTVMPVQLDGEPWEVPKSSIRISFFRQSRMIASPSEHEHWTKTQWLDPLPFTAPKKSKKSKNKKATSSADPSSSTPSYSTDTTSEQVIEIESGKKPKKSKRKVAAQEASSAQSEQNLIDLDGLTISTSEHPPNSTELLILEEVPPPRRKEKKHSLAASDPIQPIEIVELGLETEDHPMVAPAEV